MPLPRRDFRGFPEGHYRGQEPTHPAPGEPGLDVWQAPAERPVVIIGPFCSGKSTLMEALRNDQPDLLVNLEPHTMLEQEITDRTPIGTQAFQAKAAGAKGAAARPPSVTCELLMLAMQAVPCTAAGKMILIEGKEWTHADVTCLASNLAAVDRVIYLRCDDDDVLASRACDGDPTEDFTTAKIKAGLSRANLDGLVAALEGETERRINVFDASLSREALFEEVRFFMGPAGNVPTWVPPLRYAALSASVSDRRKAAVAFNILRDDASLVEHLVSAHTLRSIVLSCERLCEDLTAHQAGNGAGGKRLDAQSLDDIAASQWELAQAMRAFCEDPELKGGLLRNGAGLAIGSLLTARAAETKGLCLVCLMNLLDHPGASGFLASPKMLELSATMAIASVGDPASTLTAATVLACFSSVTAARALLVKFGAHRAIMGWVAQGSYDIVSNTGLAPDSALQTSLALAQLCDGGPECTAALRGVGGVANAVQLLENYGPDVRRCASMAMSLMQVNGLDGDDQLAAMGPFLFKTANPVVFKACEGSMALLKERRDRRALVARQAAEEAELVRIDLGLSRQRHVFVVGAPGTGKTFFTQHFEGQDKDALVVSAEDAFSKENLLSLEDAAAACDWSRKLAHIDDQALRWEQDRVASLRTTESYAATASAKKAAMARMKTAETLIKVLTSAKANLMKKNKKLEPDDSPAADGGDGGSASNPADGANAGEDGDEAAAAAADAGPKPQKVSPSPDEVIVYPDEVVRRCGTALSILRANCEKVTVLYDGFPASQEEMACFMRELRTPPVRCITLQCEEELLKERGDRKAEAEQAEAAAAAAAAGGGEGGNSGGDEPVLDPEKGDQESARKADEMQAAQQKVDDCKAAVAAAEDGSAEEGEEKERLQAAEADLAALQALQAEGGGDGNAETAPEASTAASAEAQEAAAAKKAPGLTALTTAAAKAMAIPASDFGTEWWDPVQGHIAFDGLVCGRDNLSTQPVKADSVKPVTPAKALVTLGLDLDYSWLMKRQENFETAMKADVGAFLSINTMKLIIELPNMDQRAVAKDVKEAKSAAAAAAAAAAAEKKTSGEGGGDADTAAAAAAADGAAEPSGDPQSGDAGPAAADGGGAGAAAEGDQQAAAPFRGALVDIHILPDFNSDKTPVEHGEYLKLGCRNASEEGGAGEATANVMDNTDLPGGTKIEMVGKDILVLNMLKRLTGKAMLVPRVEEVEESESYEELPKSQEQLADEAAQLESDRMFEQARQDIKKMGEDLEAERAEQLGKDFIDFDLRKRNDLKHDIQTINEKIAVIDERCALVNLTEEEKETLPEGLNTRKAKMALKTPSDTQKGGMQQEIDDLGAQIEGPPTLPDDEKATLSAQVDDLTAKMSVEAPSDEEMLVLQTEVDDIEAKLEAESRAPTDDERQQMQREKPRLELMLKTAEESLAELEKKKQEEDGGGGAAENADGDNTGEPEKTPLEKLMAREKEAKDSFESIDADGSGFVDLEELKVLIKQFHLHDDLDEAAFNTMAQEEFEKADIDKNDKLDYEEFVSYYNQCVDTKKKREENPEK